MRLLNTRTGEFKWVENPNQFRYAALSHVWSKDPRRETSYGDITRFQEEASSARARGEVLPDWGAVAEDWDGVHVSVGGLVTAHGVAVGSVESWSTVRGWNAEATLWLRWAFARATLLDLAQLPAGDF